MQLCISFIRLKNTESLAKKGKLRPAQVDQQHYIFAEDLNYSIRSDMFVVKLFYNEWHTLDHTGS